MLGNYRRIQQQRAAGEIDQGFTLIELLIVIVVLGILAAVVIFALGGITGKSAAAACAGDGATVSTALSAFNAQNSGILANASGTGALGNTAPTVTSDPTGYSTVLAEGLLSGTTDGGPYLQSWPSNMPHYNFSLNWTETTVGTATVSAEWAAQLRIVTGDTYAATVGPPPVITLTKSATGENGNLTAANLTSATSTTSTPALYPYVGPSSCAYVS